ncbi:hypothetical protein CBS101457_002400 [Exobasidium rhododendri]|nr:hypothetical protein CBS101457_002400 [Exobasidium rhododendri]
MASSIASTSVMGASLLNHAHSLVGSLFYQSTLIGVSSARPTSQARSAKAVGKQKEKRYFTSAPSRHSAWAPGQDAEEPDEGRRKRSERASKGLPNLPASEVSVTVSSIAESKARGEPIAVLTAYDYPSALALRGAPVDICLVGDSLANVALGLRTTQRLSLEAMLHHLQAVSRGLRHAALNQPNVPPVPLLIADLPYGIAQLSLEAAVEAATALVQKGGADGVKIEGSDEILPLVDRLTSFGMPVMAHVGLQPQRASSSSAFQLQGRTAHAAFDILQSALLLEEAGAFSAVLECIPNRVGAEVSKRLQMATIGIGGGQGCDGQVLVQDDIMGECSSPLHVLANLRQQGQQHQGQDQKHVGNNVDGHTSSSILDSDLWPNPPRFVRGFAKQVTGGSTIGMIRLAAVQAYVQAVKNRRFPSDEEGYKMKKEEWAAFRAILDDFDKDSPSPQDLL